MKNIIITLAATVPTTNIPKVSADQNALNATLSATFLVIGGLATLYLLIGAIKYIISNGDPNATGQAKNTILYAIVGIIVSLLAFTIVQFVLGNVR